MSTSHASGRRVVLAIMIGLSICAAAAAQTEKVIYSFTNGSDGGYPEGGLLSDGKGNYYGTGNSGGSAGSGVVFELTPNSSGWTEQVIYNFVNGTGDGGFPGGNLAFDGKGNLYGMTHAGGAYFSGTVFELTPQLNGTWTERILHSFGNGTDGKYPYAEGVVLDAAGNLYGTTNSGGAYGYGIVYELSPASNGTWTEKILYNFHNQNDGSSPVWSTPVVDSAGNVYGVASAGGAHDYGVVYELSPGSGGNWTSKVLYSFPAGAVGAYPIGNLALDSFGNLYGVTNTTAYELVRGSKGGWTEKTLHSFAGGKDGAAVGAGLVFDKAGNLYGTTTRGGTHEGTVFELSPGTNGVWSEKVLHRFAANGSDGYEPQFGAAVVIDGNGNVFGTTPWGGTSNAGVVFEIQP